VPRNPRNQISRLNIPLKDSTDSPAEGEVFLGRQPILDRAGNLAAYELLFRSGAARGAGMPEATTATATVISRVFADFDVDRVLGKQRGFINFDTELLMSDVMDFLPRERVVVELLETIVMTPAVLERVGELRRLGFTLALDDYAGAEDVYAELLPSVDIIKVDISLVSEEALPAVTSRLKTYGKRLLAEKVETREVVDRCLALGYELFQGYYFAKPVVLSGRRVSPSEQAILRLTGLIAIDAESDAIEQAFRENPELSINLMRIVNSAAVGVKQRITSLRHALIVIGRGQLNRWLQILMFALGGSPGQIFPNPLTVLAATRGKFLELGLRACGGNSADAGDRGFMTGVLSLAGALLGRPLPEILDPLPLAEEIKTAILARSGALGRLLNLIEALEAGGTQTGAQLLEDLPALDSVAVNTIYVEAMTWADSLGVESGEG
jgi:c-di-GMP-related signal transduction protein